jgi:CRP-like cAMP-binding protein
VIDPACAANPIEHVVRRLNSAMAISPGAQQALARAITVRPPIPDHVEVEMDACATFLLRGLACRTRTLPNGRLQLTAFLVPGDLCDHGFLSGCKSATRILTLSRSIVAEIRMPAFIALCDEHPDLLRALMRMTAIKSAATEEHIVSLGIRTALERMGHLFCEMHDRLETVGLVEQGAFDFPATQAELGAGLGMSAVHVNRTLQRLRRDKFITSHRGRVRIMNTAGLREMAGYDSASLNASGGEP